MLTAPPRLLLVHAHPDDETLCTGGTIARYAAVGVQVVLVTCTLGEEGEIIPPQLGQLAAHAADQLGGYRVGELRAACAALGVSDHRYLGGIGRWRDSGMVDTDANAHPRSLVAGDLAKQTAALVAIMAEVRPQVVVSYGPDGGYGHPDHIRAHEITMAACAVAQPERVFHTVSSRTAVDAGIAGLRGHADSADLPYRLPEPGELPGVADDVITTVLDVSDALPAKVRALQAHTTQISVWPDGYALSNGIAQPILREEFFALACGDPDGCATDLFGGL
jgi:N-acetyl-1-D-myo-inositol-2-amino-2-deoxy-alpha-D-glucopyranoside deacetylase